jgi:hypothetical protein
MLIMYGINLSSWRERRKCAKLSPCIRMQIASGYSNVLQTMLCSRIVLMRLRFWLLGRKNDAALAAPTASLWLYNFIKNSGTFGPLQPGTERPRTFHPGTFRQGTVQNFYSMLTSLVLMFRDQYVLRFPYTNFPHRLKISAHLGGTTFLTKNSPTCLFCNSILACPIKVWYNFTLFARKGLLCFMLAEYGREILKDMFCNSRCILYRATFCPPKQSEILPANSANNFLAGHYLQMAVNQVTAPVKGYFLQSQDKKYICSTRHFLQDFQ